jgi:LemA protein
MLVVSVVVVVGAVFAVLAVVTLYNRLVTLRRQVDTAWSRIDVQLKRRYDLIPNLVEAVKGYAEHERELLENVTSARAHAMAAAAGSNVARRAEAENAFGRAIRGFMVQVENYPQLKASQTFLALQGELTGTEDKIAFARQQYNDTVTTYNTYRERFPANILAGAFGFQPRELWQIAAATERDVPNLNYS